MTNRFMRSYAAHTGIARKNLVFCWALETANTSNACKRYRCYARVRARNGVIEPMRSKRSDFHKNSLLSPMLGLTLMPSKPRLRFIGCLPRLKPRSSIACENCRSDMAYSLAIAAQYL